MIKKVIVVLMCFILALPVINNSAAAYSAVSYCLYDPICDKVIAAADMNRKMPMASTTKIMTAILTLELRDMTKTVKITKEMIAVEGSSVGLRLSDEISTECLLYGMMLESGNDAALSLAVDIAGSQKSFAILMNAKAKQLGMKNTSFVTPNGLDDENHYSTAYDMALLAGYAMNNEAFRTIVAATTYKAYYNNGETVRTYSNHNRLLRMLEGAEGVKTGFTKKSGRCLVSSCKRYGIRLIAVTLKAGDDWNDHKALYNYGYSQYEQVTLPSQTKFLKVTGSKTKEIMVKSAPVKIYFYNGLYSSIKYRSFLPKFVYAPIKYSESVGYIEYSYNNNIVAVSDYFATKGVKKIKAKKESFIQKLIKHYIMLLSIK